jgi:basic amino acid/polyamine antiporter, APA family
VLRFVCTQQYHQGSPPLISTEETYLENLKSKSYSADPTGQLRKVLGVTFGIAVTIGGMIGLGILRTPGSVAAQLSSPWLILGIWLIGGLYALCGVFSAAELGVSMPRTGGWYVYARRAFGEFAGFAAGWMDYVAYPGTLAIVSITIAEYWGSLFPDMAKNVKLTAIAALLMVGFINWLGVRWGGRFQEIVSFAKAGVFVAIIGAAFIFGENSAGSNPVAAFASPMSSIAAIVIALQSVIYAYDGWYAAIYFSEETKDRTGIPRSMVAAVVLVTIIYVLVNAALLYALPMENLASSTLPVAELANRIFGVYGDKIVTLLALITLLSLLNANLLTGPRILFAMSRDGLFADRVSDVNAGGTPSTALLLTIALPIPVILTGSFETILAITAFLFIVLYVSGFLAVIVLRWKEPDLDRPYKAFGYPWTTGVVLLGSFAFMLAALVTDTINSLYAIGLMILSVPFYYLVKRINRKLK